MITIDIETKSDKDIAKCGVYAYADSPYFDILLFAYSVDGQPVQVVDTANGEEIPENILAALADETIGAILVLLPFVKRGSVVGSPAPEIITSAPASMAVNISVIVIQPGI